MPVACQSRGVTEPQRDRCSSAHTGADELEIKHLITASRQLPPCGARKMLRAYADPCIFRPLRKLRFPFFRHRRREPAIPPCAGKAPLSHSVRTGDFPRRGKQGPPRASAPTGKRERAWFLPHHPSVRTGELPPLGEAQGCEEKALRDVEDEILRLASLAQDDRTERGAFPLSVNRRADTPVDSSPRRGAKWRALHFGKGAIAGDGRSFWFT